MNKVYIVLRTINKNKGGQVSREILSTFKTLQAAKDFLKQTPGENLLENRETIKQVNLEQFGETWFYDIETYTLHG